MNAPQQSRSGGLSPSRRLLRARGQTAVYLRRRLGSRRSLLAVASVFLSVTLVSADPVFIGSKKFTESYVLAEIAKRALENAGIKVEHRPGMGGTIILWEALRGGGIDVYPEYTGTIAEEMLKQPGASIAQIRNALSAQGIAMTDDLGFNNTYALVMRRDQSEQLGLTTISDLRAHRELKFGLTHEFLERRDGWRPLSERYQLAPSQVLGVDHALGYAALAKGEIDVKDAYSTDAKIGDYGLVTLIDDLHFFPQYKAVFLYRKTLSSQAAHALNDLSNSIDEGRMIRLNSEAERTKNYAAAAQQFFGTTDGAIATPFVSESFRNKLLRWVTRHLELAGISLLLAIIVGLPLGIVASRGGAVGHAILGATGIIQTIPSLALLALLVPLPFFGISARTAIVALFLYGLLPIVRNTATGLQDISRPLRESAIALGLTAGQRLRKIFLPLASRSILAGIKTSAVINIGTATLAALIGAGGLGEPIISGLNLNDHVTILEGAIPAALLALFVQFGFDLLDRVLIPRGLRL
ncbi:MAG: glycine/betaine ABC transporter substrate-binding protein [Verrucomicrobia bacterium]|nr:MAG: glycine/betaine ABC transporter substrate-binding protein [Verrucomicrobiota bacterium]